MNNSEHTVRPVPEQGQDEKAPDWIEQVKAREAAGFFWNETPKEKAAREAKIAEDIRAAQEAAERTEKIKRGIPPDDSPLGPKVRMAKPEDIKLEFAMDDTKTETIHYLSNPWLPLGQVIGFYGRGETGKSSFAATLAAQGSEEFSTLWVSTEEPKDWIMKRHMQIGQQAATLAIPDIVVTDKDKEGRAMASSFNTYQHLEPAIQRAKQEFESIHEGRRPLRLVVLDTVVALTTWQRNESPNDDASTKRLLAYLFGLAQKYAITIIVIGHSNKGKHDVLADTVAGSAAWVNSLRQAFIFVHDQSVEHHNVVCTVKGTLTGTFAAQYRTEPVHRLFKRADGKDSVLCQVILGDIEWGRLDAYALVDSALGRDQDDDEDDHNDTSVMQAVNTVLAQLRAGATSVSRDAVHSLTGQKIHNRLWKKVDSELTKHPVKTVRGERGKIFYERK
jgi:hypothetical protein